MRRMNVNTRIARILHKERQLEESNPRYRIEKAIQDLLLSADFPSSEYFELANIHKQEE